MNNLNLFKTNKELYKLYKNEVGLCLTCKEMTSIKNPCCNGSILFQGIVINPNESSHSDNKRKT